ncbi:hypothetical protein [Hyalangium sp.]|uniref:hypothetical protein n=1 Tax=Hyalangium sp. TaxID=2028555 RepID=UPI002D68E02B|nr:hypothetical protein [Hyalangium sp.]HYH98902.1 hypothetical protein [Hyalangium sp.]
MHRLALPPLLLGLLALPAKARAEEPPPPKDSSPLKVDLDLGGSRGALEHPATTLPPNPIGLQRTASDRASATRLSLGARLALSQFFNVRSLWQTNVLDWYLTGDLRIFSLRVGVEKELALSRRVALGLGVHGAAAEASFGTGETVFNAPSIPDTGPAPDSVQELRASQWLFGLGGNVSLLFLTGSPLYVRLQAGFTQYLSKANHFETRGRDYTPEGFSVSLSGPSAGLSVGVRL